MVGCCLFAGVDSTSISFFVFSEGGRGVVVLEGVLEEEKKK